MKQKNEEVLVIGSGIAGLVFALACAEKYRVHIVCKGSLMQTNTVLAQGGIAAAMALPDSPESHYRDTLRAGDGLCDEEAVRFLVNEAADAIRFLENKGMKFAHTEEGNYDLALEGAHSQPRVMHVQDHTGKTLMETLGEAVLRHPDIRVDEFCLVDHLVMQKGRCVGASYFRKNAKTNEHAFAPVTLLAAGGAGQLYATSTNPEAATGDGFALADEAGAEMRNMEFVQFHPTLLYAPGKEPFLISEALRGAGAVLCDKQGRPFMEKLHPLGSLAPRDLVSRSIFRQMEREESPCVFLDIRAHWSEKTAAHFSSITARCREEGIDPGKDLIPVHPAAHYMCGGVRCDLQGRSSIPGLLVSGENACTGVHGANRLASNSLLEAVVFSLSASRLLLKEGLPVLETGEPETFLCLDEDPYEDLVLDQIHKKLQKIMTQHVGIMRNPEGLKEAANFIQAMLQCHLFSGEGNLSLKKITVKHMLRTASLIVEAATKRKISRGSHYIKAKKVRNEAVPV